MSSNDNYSQFTFLINFSNSRRKVIEDQRMNQKIKFRKYSVFELAALQYFPVLLTSTLLAPLHRLKVLLQCYDILKNKTTSASELYKGII
jgi:hypothetical protein